MSYCILSIKIYRDKKRGIETNVSEQQKENGKTIWKTIGLVLSAIFIIVYMSVLLREFEKDVREEETKSLVLAMANLSDQGAAMVEERVSASLQNIKYIAKLLEDKEDIKSEEIMKNLNHILSEQDTGVNRFGVATPDGSSRVSNGDVVDVSERDFFKNSMQGKTFVSESTELKILDEEVFFLSSPVFGVQGEVKGVLYGIIETDNYKIYDNEDLTENNKNQYIVDSEGNYIGKFLYRETMLNKENLFSDLAAVGSQMPVGEIRQYMEKKQSTYTEIWTEKNRDYVYITPIDINEWYVVTVVDGDSMTSKISHLQSHAVQLIGQILVILLLFLIGYFGVVSFEKRKTEKMNRELRIRDSIFQIATSEMDSFVFLYDAMKDQMDFMNDSMDKLGIPKSIKNVSREIRNCVDFRNQIPIEKFINQMKKDMEAHLEKSECDITVEQKKGTCYYQVKMTHLYDNKNRPVRSIGMIYDITEKRIQEIQLEKEEKLRSLFMIDTIAFYEINITQNQVLKKNNEMQKNPRKYSEAFETFMEHRVLEQYRALFWDKCSLDRMKQYFQNQAFDYGLEYECKDDKGIPYWVASEIHLGEEQGEIIAFLTIRDIDNKKRKELHLEQTAVYDTVTKVYNRSAGMQKINQVLESTDSEETGVFMILDLDGFKQLNDNLGHMTGDHALAEVAKVLVKHFRSYDVVCRLGGDEFIIFARKLPKEVLDKVLSSLLKKLLLTYGSGEQQVTISASIGVAFAPEQGKDFAQLYEKADKALYLVKKSRKNNYRIYEER